MTLIAIALLGEAVIATGRVITVLAGTAFAMMDLPDALGDGALPGGAFSGAVWGFDNLADLIATDDLAEDLAAGLAGALCADALDFEGLFTDVLATEPLAPFAQNRPCSRRLRTVPDAVRS